MKHCELKLWITIQNANRFCTNNNSMWIKNSAQIIIPLNKWGISIVGAIKVYNTRVDI